MHAELLGFVVHPEHAPTTALGYARMAHLFSPSGDLDGEAPSAEWGDDQPAPRVGGIRLGMAWGTERHQPVELEVRAPLGALDDVVDLEARVLYWRPAWGASLTGSERM